MLAFGLTLALVDKFSSPMTKAANLLDKFRGTTAKTGETAKRLVPDVAGVLKSFETVRLNPTIDAANELSDSLERLHESGERATQFGKKAGMIGAGLLMAGRGMLAREQQALQQFADRESAGAYIQTLAPGTFGSPQEDVARAMRAADEWSLKHQDSATAYLEATYQLLSAGFDTRQALAGTESALLLATSARGNPAESANLVATAYNTLGNRAADPDKELRRITNTIAKTQAVFQIANLGVLSQGLNMAFSTAMANNESLEELAGTIGFLNNVGVQGSMAGTAYAASMRQMLRASKELGFELVQNAQGGIDLLGSLRNLKAMYGDQMNLPKVKRAFQQAFGDEGLKAVTLIVNKMSEYEAGLQNVSSSMGTVEKNAAIIEDTFAAGENRRGNAADMAMAQWGKSFKAPWEWMKNLKAATAEWFGMWLSDSPIVSKIVGVLTAAVTGTVLVAGGAALAIGGVALAVGGYARAIEVLTANNLPRLVRALRLLVRGPLPWMRIGALRLGGALRALWLVHLPRAAAATRAWAMTARMAAKGGLARMALSIKGIALAVKGLSLAVLTNPLTWWLAGLAAAAVLAHKLWTNEKWRKNYVSDAPATGASLGIGSMHGGAGVWHAVGRAWRPEQNLQAARALSKSQALLANAPHPEDVKWRSPEMPKAQPVDVTEMAQQWQAALVLARDADKRREGPATATINIEHLNLDAKDVDEQEKLLSMLLAQAQETGL